MSDGWDRTCKNISKTSGDSYEMRILQKSYDFGKCDLSGSSKLRWILQKYLEAKVHLKMQYSHLKCDTEVYPTGIY